MDKVSTAFKFVLEQTAEEVFSKKPKKEWKFEDILRSLQEHPSFHLTGSRYFGNDDLVSDWDFFTDKGQASFLEYLGFKRFNVEYYSDLNIHAFYRFEEEEGKQIDVQVVESVTAKLAVQTLLKETGHLDKLDKLQRVKMWNLALRAYYLASLV